MEFLRTGKRRSYPELRGSADKIVYPAWAEIKFDGEFNWYINDHLTPPFFVNKSGTLRRWEICQIVADLIKEPVQLIGEMCWGVGRKGDLYEFLKHQKDDLLRFRPFDIVMYKHQGLTREPFIARKELLTKLFPRMEVCGKIVHDKKEMEDYFDEVVGKGFEGIVVKGLNSPLLFGPCSWVKIKKLDDSNFIIHSIDPVRERIEVEVPVAGKGTPTKPVIRTVGVKVCNKDKAGLNVRDVVNIEYQGILANGGLRHPVFKGKVVNDGSKVSK